MKQLEVGNATAGAITFRMALTTVEDGTPGTSNAFLAWDTVVSGGGVDQERRGAAVGSLFLWTGLKGGFDDLYWGPGGDRLEEER